MEPKLDIKIQDKIIIITDGKKDVEFDRFDEQGILIESCYNNPNIGIKESLLEVAVTIGKAVPKLDEGVDQDIFREQWQKNWVNDLANKQNRALIYFTNGKIHIEISDKGIRLCCPNELQKGFQVLMKLFDSKKKKITQKHSKELQSFFTKCQLDLSVDFTETKGLQIKGNDFQKLAQFMKSCVGLELDKIDGLKTIAQELF